MITKLPRWAWAFAWILSFIGGMINVVGFLGFSHQAITHLTGTTTLLASALAAGDLSRILHFGATIGSFVFGCMLSGFLIQDGTLRLGYRYGVALFLESLLLLAAVPLLTRANNFGLYCAAAACGVQNAMMSTFSGTVVRTTHVSGMFTDLGVFLGHAVCGLPIDSRRLRLCIIVISGFLFGGFLSARLFQTLGYRVLLFPSVFTGVTSIGFGAYCLRKCCGEATFRPPS